MTSEAWRILEELEEVHGCWVEPLDALTSQAEGSDWAFWTVSVPMEWLMVHFEVLIKTRYDNQIGAGEEGGALRRMGRGEGCWRRGDLPPRCSQAPS